MSSPPANDSRWPVVLADLCRRVRLTVRGEGAEGGTRVGEGPDSTAGPLYDQIWILLNAALRLCLRAQSSHGGILSQEDIEDIASEKALEIHQGIVTGRVEIAGPSAGQVATFLSSVARNALIDHYRKSKRLAPAERSHPAEGGSDVLPKQTHEDSTAHQVEAREYARALTKCLSELAPRSRLVWFFRTFYGFSTKEIAAHAEVLLKPGHVDVVLQRARGAIQDCLRTHGFAGDESPRGTFTEVWLMFRRSSWVATADLGLTVQEQAT